MSARLSSFGQARRKYFFTPELERDLRRAYCGTKSEITANLDRMERVTGWPRHAFKTEAQRLGIITGDHRRDWTAEECLYLAEHFGESAKRLAAALHRSVGSVQARLTTEMPTGAQYTRADLQILFGQTNAKVRRWIARGLFGPRCQGAAEPRIAERDVNRFIADHASEYDLALVNQAWFKALVFGKPTLSHERPVGEDVG